MASDTAIIAALKSHVRQILASAERDTLTVNKVRALVENELELENGYLKGGNWKDRSKEVIKDESVCPPFLIYFLDFGERLALGEAIG
jgi:hypothetical protein